MQPLCQVPTVRANLLSSIQDLGEKLMKLCTRIGQNHYLMTATLQLLPLVSCCDDIFLCAKDISPVVKGETEQLTLTQQTLLQQMMETNVVGGESMIHSICSSQAESQH